MHGAKLSMVSEAKLFHLKHLRMSSGRYIMLSYAKQIRRPTNGGAPLRRQPKALLEQLRKYLA